ncbi:sulfite exporter TauE/SafE family protein 3-like [Papaver somniferum]|uniref:sulfite exporter TauE/SafE family protein 3-like n=1 Tax=Papaver somniferum TaxID=3469 RepID=UPI000E6F635D|nr:sulfite exporter TauE/SafE family protein 3-like [Papaver somniferum]
MAQSRTRFLHGFLGLFAFVLLFVFVTGERDLKDEIRIEEVEEVQIVSNYFTSVKKFLWDANVGSVYEHVWPEMKFGWRIIVGSVIGFLGAAFGSVGGIGSGGIFVPMLTLIIGFDAKSAAPISKCMIVGLTVSTVYYNLKRRHPTIDMPMIDYNLALLIQPMLMLGISIGVTCSVIFADWMLTVLLIIFFVGTSTMSFFKGVDKWKQETILKKEAANRLKLNDSQEALLNKPLLSSPSLNDAGDKEEVPILENIQWREFSLIVFVWVSFLVLQIAKINTATCSVWYWILNLTQIPVAVGVASYGAVSLYTGKTKIASIGEHGTNFKVHQLITYCFFGVLAGMVGGLLGLGGGFILGPLFLEMGIPPQVSSATAIFAMTFSASMAVIEYYLLHRFPVPYALYFMGVAVLAALAGQHVVRKVIKSLGRTSIIIFILAFTIFISAIFLGGTGIANIIVKIHQKEYMGFENLCKA